MQPISYPKSIQWTACAALLAGSIAGASVAAAGAVSARERVSDDRVFGSALTYMTKNGFAFSLGGYANLAYIYGLLEDTGCGDCNDSSSAQDGVFQDAEIHFGASKKVPSLSTEFGYKLQLEAATKGDQIDEHYGYVKGPFGELIVGAENDAAFLLQTHAPNFVAGLKFYANNYEYQENAHKPNDGSLSLALADVHATALSAVLPADAYGVALSGATLARSRPGGEMTDSIYETRHAQDAISDANKLTYKTPRLYGLQAGLSYVPSASNKDGEEGNLALNSRFDHVIGYGLNYKGKLEGVSVAASFGHLFDDAGEGETPFQEFSVGAQLGYGPVKLGGSWILRQNWRLFQDTNANGFHVAATTRLDFLTIPVLEDTVLGVGYTRTMIDGSDARVRFYDNADPTDSAAMEVASIKLGELAGVDQVFQSIQVGGNTQLIKGVNIGYFWQWTDQQFAGNYFNDSTHNFLGLLLALKF